MTTQVNSASVSRHNEHRPKAVMLCGWGVKAGRPIARIWWHVKLNPCIIRVISESCRDKVVATISAIQIDDYFTLLHSMST